MANTNDSKSKKGFGLMHAGMAICCTIMLIPIAGFFIAGGTLAGLTSNLSVLAPIALCIGAHVAMFALMGKSCHGDAKTKKSTEQETALQPSRIPAVTLSD